ncbi:oxidoreductase [Flavobacterium sp. IMCC34852]|uniref:Oxidoreductase n=1 Tax=Flavobacterium rivulicola TaxID=2732161 RepID=A0A7Y3R7U1_9FLAO|nr:oxidoreductase [Flavobacterium sp. IMCC34852]NNT71441.1 oxidoreductase [Flavobacterium sp. IMCC34852]
MKNQLFLYAVFFLILGTNVKAQTFQSIKIDTILKDKISIRAIHIAKDRLYYTGSLGKVGYIRFDNNPNVSKQVVIADTPQRECRSIAANGTHIFALSIGDSARLRKISADLKERKTVYKEFGKKVFYDCMQFWNEKEGIAIGDPTADCLSIIITRDSGNTWQKLSCENLPKTVDGEAAFAASNTNIVIKGNHTWVVSGGKKSRVFHSNDKGKTWEVYETPIVQGEAMTGIFTADFYNENIGFIAGGNYEKPNQNFQNKAITTDGGKTWKLIGENTGFGYASCVQFVPKSKGKGIVSVGANGLHYSADGGYTWQQLSTDPTLYTIRFLDKDTAFAAGKDKIIKIEFKK